MNTAIYRERAIKEWEGAWKIALIEKINFKYLYPDWFEIQNTYWIAAIAGMTSR